MFQDNIVNLLLQAALTAEREGNNAPTSEPNAFPSKPSNKTPKMSLSKATSSSTLEYQRTPKSTIDKDAGRSSVGRDESMMDKYESSRRRPWLPPSIEDQMERDSTQAFQLETKKHYLKKAVKLGDDIIQLQHSTLPLTIEFTDKRPNLYDHPFLQNSEFVHSIKGDSTVNRNLNNSIDGAANINHIINNSNNTNNINVDSSMYNNANSGSSPNTLSTTAIGQNPAQTEHDMLRNIFQSSAMKGSTSLLHNTEANPFLRSQNFNNSVQSAILRRENQVDEEQGIDDHQTTEERDFISKEGMSEQHNIPLQSDANFSFQLSMTKLSAGDKPDENGRKETNNNDEDKETEEAEAFKHLLRVHKTESISYDKEHGNELKPGESVPHDDLMVPENTQKPSAFANTTGAFFMSAETLREKQAILQKRFELVKKQFKPTIFGNQPRAASKTNRQHAS
eukprot:TRINITY_DN10036_c0_g2_i1.p1 TRINITY_DN10036_c0_g2~~TRINITY_DN10036_c0_g2_i1.p1  ORF type:complete len:451 (+),score=90.33 TRINITY_DN10036_c0_g2_i1:590-1942(+)